jgi:hypothetical protein
LGGIFTPLKKTIKTGKPFLSEDMDPDNGLLTWEEKINRKHALCYEFIRQKRVIKYRVT